jgi:hypothetical protein
VIALSALLFPLLLFAAGGTRPAVCPLQATGPVVRACGHHPTSMPDGQPGPAESTRWSGWKTPSRRRTRRSDRPQPIQHHERTSHAQRHHRTQVHEGPQEGRGQVLAAVRALVPAHPTRHPRRPRQTEVRLPGWLPYQGRRAIGARPGARPPRRPLGPRPSREAKQWRWWAGTADPQRPAGPLARPPANQQGPPAANRRTLPPTAGPPPASLPRREPRRLAWDPEHPTAVRPAGPMAAARTARRAGWVPAPSGSCTCACTRRSATR